MLKSLRLSLVSGLLAVAALAALERGSTCGRHSRSGSRARARLARSSLTRAANYSKGESRSRGTTRKHPWALLALVAALLALAPSALAAAGGQTGFGFNAGEISGFPTGAVFLTGGGAYNPATGFVHSAGGFRCMEAVEQGPLAGCLAGQGVRWDTAELLAETKFKCTGQEGEAAKQALTDETTAVLLSDFYRAGDGNDESFTAQMIVSQHDIAPDIEGVQNVWIQGVGCGTATVHFSR
jgi:hypothetical protein